MTNPFNDIEGLAEQLRFILTEAPKQFDANADDIAICEKEILDIEHALELTNFNAAEGFKYAKDIQVARMRRRKLKDENMQLKHLVEAIRSIKVDVNKVNKAIGEIRKVKELNGRRGYKVRVRQDLQPIIDKGGRVTCRR